jgi:hypothetical protein
MRKNIFYDFMIASHWKCTKLNEVLPALRLHSTVVQGTEERIKSSVREQEKREGKKERERVTEIKQNTHVTGI